MQFPLTLIAVVLVAWQLDSLLVSGQVHFKKGAPHVKLANGGLLSGIVKFSRDGRPYNSFVGIQYATAERFQEPQPITVPSWQGILSATKPGAMCPQRAFTGTEVYGEEDCLSLNVYVPMNNTGTGKRGYAVMVWVHGGGFTYGSGVTYSPSYFMDEDVIIVTFNYRLGAFGFLSTGDGVIPGNYGMKDMVAVLKWVQQNIKQFGGDPNKVTVFGESAGGSAVHYLLLSPTTKGLFHRAISQSGSALNQWAYDANPRSNAVDLATYLNCPSAASTITSEEILTCLKGKTAEELNKAQFEFRTSWPNNWRSFYFAPTAEPSVDASSTQTPFLTEPPISLINRKDSVLSEVPWMTGATEDEGISMYAAQIIADTKLLGEINTGWESIAPSVFDYGRYLPQEEQAVVSEKLKQFYLAGQQITEENKQGLSDAFTDELILHGVYRSAMETASRGKKNPVYLYQYAYKGPLQLMSLSFPALSAKNPEKVGHGDDLQHLFDFGTAFGGQQTIEPESPDEEFSKNLVRLLVSFAIHGEPKHSWGDATFKKWKSISKKELDGINPLRWYRIDANPVSYDISQSVKDRMQFWDDLWSQHLTPAILANYQLLTAAGQPRENTETTTTGAKTEL